MTTTAVPIERPRVRITRHARKCWHADVWVGTGCHSVRAKSERAVIDAAIRKVALESIDFELRWEAS